MDLPDGHINDFLLCHKKQVKLVKSFDECYSVGKYRKLNDKPANIEHFDLDGSLRQYHRLLKNGLLYVAESYRNILKTDSSHVEFLYKQKKCFGKVLYFIKKK